MKDAHKYNSVVPSKSIFTDETEFCMYDVMGDKRKELILPDFYTCTTGGFGMVYYSNSDTKNLRSKLSAAVRVKNNPLRINLSIFDSHIKNQEPT